MQGSAIGRKTGLSALALVGLMVWSGAGVAQEVEEGHVVTFEKNTAVFHPRQTSNRPR